MDFVLNSCTFSARVCVYTTKSQFSFAFRIKHSEAIKAALAFLYGLYLVFELFFLFCSVGVFWSDNFSFGWWIFLICRIFAFSSICVPLAIQFIKIFITWKEKKNDEKQLWKYQVVGEWQQTITSDILTKFRKWNKYKWLF